ncbi:uncharacterized protein LOC125683168 [Ostrea edulis]|uniref:uncharacterized protein LOC125683168 n=1 Tax=Ostrea edulis TaxID=37623 RepID=UPI0024AF15E0|nr:uncharacterized protein LOC125683168 [Ostrea edulis]
MNVNKAKGTHNLPFYILVNLLRKEADLLPLQKRLKRRLPFYLPTQTIEMKPKIVYSFSTWAPTNVSRVPGKFLHDNMHFSVTHAVYGNIGCATRQRYRQMMKSDETIEFICTRCREDETDRAPAFLRLSQRATSPELRSLVQYIENAWLDSPVWNPRNWSFYRQSIRTNNDVDGYHTRINADIGRGHMSFYIVVPALRRETNIVDLTFRLVSEEQILRDQRRKQARLECRLHQCWQDYEEGERTVSQLLSDCGRIYGPSND